MAIKKIATYTNQSDFDRVGLAIEQHNAGYKELLQQASVGALLHLEKHGNFNVLKPLWKAATTFSTGEGRKWHKWILEYSFMTYNPAGLRGEKLSKAAFQDLWRKDKSKHMNVDGARKNAWHDYKVQKAERTEPVNLSKYVATFIRGLNDLLEHNLVAMPATGKSPVRMATPADVRSELRAALETIVSRPKNAKPAPNKADKPAPKVKAKAPAKVTATPMTAAKKMKKAA